MTNLTLHPESPQLIKPEPREGPISIRPATERDMAFIDGLQKAHSKQVGFLRTGDIQAYIANGGVLIAEDAAPPRDRIGYVLFKDKYMHREELGVCFQLNVAPRKQRGLVGAALIQAAFDHCAYGTKLFCCWCAQDIEANHFWESIGFVPLAYRAGSRGKAQGGKRKDQRIHIFWQKRIREGDVGSGATPWWYPSHTEGGALKEGRIVLPIEPGTHWSDVKLVVLPGSPTMDKMTEAKALEGGGGEGDSQRVRGTRTRAPKVKRPSIVPGKTFGAAGLRFGPPETVKAEKAPKPAPAKRQRQKNDPKLVAAAREFRDRYLEQVNAEGGDRLLASNGKYDVSRQLAGAEMVQSMASSSVPHLLEAA